VTSDVQKSGSDSLIVILMRVVFIIVFVISFAHQTSSFYNVACQNYNENLVSHSMLWYIHI